jgi:hypothetical protein
MAHVKIEPTGCHERNGIIQVRLDFFLDEGDYRYNDFHIKTLDLPKDEKGKVLINNDEEYQEELKTKPFKWVDAPFHIHLIYVSEDTPDSEIDDIAEAFLHEAYFKLGSDAPRDLVNNYLPKTVKSFDTKKLSSRVDAIRSKDIKRAI